jgi:hypothetical protein
MATQHIGYQTAQDTHAQMIYEREKAWGLPLTSLDDWMQYSVRGASEIKEMFEDFNFGDGPFLAGGKTSQAASQALLTLRKKKELSDEEISQLCWLELSLMDAVTAGIFLSDTSQRETEWLSDYDSVVTPHQIELVRLWLKDDFEEDDFEPVSEEELAAYRLKMTAAQNNPHSESSDTITEATREMMGTSVARAYDKMNSHSRRKQEMELGQFILNYMQAIC